MNNLIDLHVHSTASDGSFTPTEIIQKASLLGMRAIAITDHDTVDGLEEGEIAAVQASIEFIRGCELSTRHGVYDVHIVGLWIPKDIDKYPEFVTSIQTFQANREKRNNSIIEKLQALGIEISIKEVENLAGGRVIGRPHFAQFLKNKGIVASEQEAFEEYLGRDKKAYVPRKAVTPHEAVQILAKTGATVVLAHPALIPCSLEELDELISELSPLGLNALEAYHSAHSFKDERVLVGLAAKHELLLSGGSDFHGKSKPGVALAKGKGSLRIPYFVLEKMKAKRA